MEKIYTNADGSQKAELFIPDSFKRLGVSVSGGTDSALTLYLVCSLITECKKTDVEIAVVHCVDIVRTAKSKKGFDLIIDKFENEFPNIKFIRRYTQFVETETSKKGEAIRKESAKAISELGIQGWFIGLTKNPPTKVCETIGIIPPEIDKRYGDVITDSSILRMYNKERSRTTDKTECDFISSKFLATVDRSFVAEYFNKIKFLKDLFPLTASCVGGLFETKGWTQPCKNCWWCKEKFWAFHQYDGGTL
jgi:hypothetical protein